MTKFLNPYENPAYVKQAILLYLKYSKFLDDDYADAKNDKVQYFLDLINRTYPYFWVITEGEKVSGFVYLDNIIGNNKKYHSAELVTCFDKNYWGIYTKICAYCFLRLIFQKYGFEKIKALIYPENFRVKNLLLYSGFSKEALLKNETKRNGKLQDIEIYSILKERL